MYPSLFMKRELGRSRFNKFEIPVDIFLEDYTSSSSDLHVIEGQDGAVEVPPFTGSFCNDISQGHMLAVADEDGAVIIYNTNLCGPIAAIKEWLAHTNAVFDISWLKGENKLLTASGDQTIVLWDVVSEEKLDVFKGHSSSVKSVGLQTDNTNVFASGSRDGHIMLWDRRYSKKGGVATPLNSIRNAHLLKASANNKTKRKSRTSQSQDFQQSVTSVVFQDENTVISCGAVDGAVKMWDLRKNYSIAKKEPIPKFTFQYSGTSVRKHGFTNLVLDSTRTRLFVSCMDDIIYQYNCANCNPKPVATYKGHQNSTFYVKSSLSPDDRFLLTGSSDYHAYIYEVDKPKASPVMLKGHSGEVTSVCWSPSNNLRIATLSDDSTVRIWRGERHGDTDVATIGQILGQACRTHREIGTTCVARNDRTLTSCHGAFLSPIKNPKVVSNRSMPLLPSPSFKYPNLKAWVENMAHKSPRKLPPASPRKLIISPLKHHMLGNSKLANTEHTTPGRGVKRKRDDENLVDASKRQCTNIAESNNRKPLSPCCIDVRNILPDKSRTSTRKHLDFDCVDGPLGLIEKSPILMAKCSNVRRSFSSPTSNLPNYVLDPKPRAPVGIAADPSDIAKSRDWLTEMSQKRRTSIQIETSVASPRGTETPSRRRRSVDPTSASKKTPRRSRPSSPAVGTPSTTRTSSPSNYQTPSRRKRKLDLTTPSSTGESPSMRKGRSPAVKGNKSILQFFSPVSKDKTGEGV
ncbi:denticleless protein homolog [Tubulanus polymorphus]|uniref:denticleless protein homolog n=1 Tax=Tubulanus polymorphus TaxID=672921 RepID=UPI003DA4A56F